MSIYGEPRGKGISTKHIGSHRWSPKHVRKDDQRDDAQQNDSKKKDNGK